MFWRKYAWLPSWLTRICLWFDPALDDPEQTTSIFVEVKWELPYLDAYFGGEEGNRVNSEYPAKSFLWIILRDWSLEEAILGICTSSVSLGLVDFINFHHSISSISWPATKTTNFLHGLIYCTRLEWTFGVSQLLRSNCKQNSLETRVLLVPGQSASSTLVRDSAWSKRYLCLRQSLWRTPTITDKDGHRNFISTKCYSVTSCTKIWMRHELGARSSLFIF